MGRIPRKIIPGQPYHVTHRGNHRLPILQTDQQRAVYISIMRRWQLRTGVRIAAFVLMPNHVHFVVVSPTPEALTKWIANGHREYSKWLNTTRGTTGHNWEGRYFAAVMDPEHCLNALRYVEQNPVAARLSTRPWDWNWSSAAFHAGMGPQPSILDLDLRPAGTTAAAWRQSLLEPSAEEFRARLHECAARGTALADPAWAEAMERMHGVRLLPRQRGRRRQKESTPNQQGGHPLEEQGTQGGDPATATDRRPAQHAAELVQT